MRFDAYCFHRHYTRTMAVRFKSTRFSRHVLLRNACFHGCLNLQRISQYIIHNDILDYGLYSYVVKLNF